MKLGFGLFNFVKERYDKHCRACGKQINPEDFTSLGIRRTKMTIDGIYQTQEGLYEEIKDK